MAFEPGVSHGLSSVLTLLATRYPTYRIRSAQALSATVGDSIRHRRFPTLLFAAFGVSAIVIVGVGVLGLVAIVTSRRTREVGVRMALGARPSEIASLVVRQELMAVVLGLAAGTLISLWAVRFVQAYMYKMTVYDPRAWGAAVTTLVAVAAFGALVPAIRASRVDPVRALRIE